MDSRVYSIGDLELGSKSPNRKYALTGHTWAVIREFHPSFVKSVLKDGVIFARMSSDQKQQVIQELQSAQFYVGKMSMIIKIS